MKNVIVKAIVVNEARQSCISITASCHTQYRKIFFGTHYDNFINGIQARAANFMRTCVFCSSKNSVVGQRHIRYFLYTCSRTNVSYSISACAIYLTKRYWKDRVYNDMMQMFLTVVPQRETCKGSISHFVFSKNDIVGLHMRAVVLMK